MKNKVITAEMKVSPPQTCQWCGNQYLLIWITEGVKYQDFGERYCPFCRRATEVFSIPAD